MQVRKALPTDVDAVVAISRTRPKHFVDEGVGWIATSVTDSEGAVAVDDNKKVIGFLTWESNDVATELLWMATLESAASYQAGKRLLAYCFQQIDMSKRVFLRTATPDSVIDGTQFDGSAFFRTISYFEHMGFRQTSVERDFWRTGNHCLSMDLDKSKTPLLSGASVTYIPSQKG